MNNIQPQSHHDAVTFLYAEKMIASFREQMNEAAHLAEELNNLLANCESMLEHEDMRGQVVLLSRWAERYRQGLMAADKISQNGKAWLTSLSNRLNLEARELTRLEGEGGRITNGKHTGLRTEDFASAARQVGAIASRIEYLFGRPATKDPHIHQ